MDYTPVPVPSTLQLMRHIIIFYDQSIHILYASPPMDGWMADTDANTSFLKFMHLISAWL